MTKVSICDVPLVPDEALRSALADPPAGGERAERMVVAPMRPSLLRRLIRGIDWGLRRLEGIREFSDRNDCLLRISPGRAGADTRLGDGTTLARGAEVLDLHLWNEHLPNLCSATLARTSALRRRFEVSLRDLAAYLEKDPAMAGVAALRARTAFVPYNQMQKVRHVTAAYGFDMVEYAERGSVWWRAHDFLENFLICALAWTYNPSTLRGKGLLRPRCEFWISRAAFLKRYGGLREVPRHKLPEQRETPAREDLRDRVGKRRIKDEHAVPWYGFAGGAAVRHKAVPDLEPAQDSSGVEGFPQPLKP